MASILSRLGLNVLSFAVRIAHMILSHFHAQLGGDISHTEIYRMASSSAQPI